MIALCTPQTRADRSRSSLLRTVCSVSAGPVKAGMNMDASADMSILSYWRTSTAVQVIRTTYATGFNPFALESQP